MKKATLLTAALALALASMLCLGGCKKEEPSRWDQAASAKPVQPAADTPPPPPKEKGGSFNAFFPTEGPDGAKRVFTQEKDGFAEAKLQKDGKDVATLSISDATSDAAAKGKFASATEKVGDAPLVTVGKNQSAILVKDKYQVKVSSQTLDANARKALLAKFDISGLSKL